MSTKEVFLEGNPPWGFRMNGGADAGHPLRISRVNPGSKAEAKGVREGDLITSINGQSTKCLTNSESHALLRTVKENLLLGLNEDKSASPRRRSREIKTASIISQEKERSESPIQTKGNVKSSSQKRHQRRTRLKHRIKEMFGLKTKEKSNPEDEEWVIVDSSLKSETRSLTNSLPEEDKNIKNFSRANSEPVAPPNDEIYDNFSFQSSNIIPNNKANCTFHESKVVVSIKEEGRIENPNIDNSINFDKDHICSDPTIHNYENQKYIDKHYSEEKHLADNRKNYEIIKHTMPTVKKIKTSEGVVPYNCEKSALEVHIGDEVSESLSFLPPTEMVEVCNATIMVEDDRPVQENSKTPVICFEDCEQTNPCHSSNPDYEPVEVNSSVIIYPPYSSTLSYYFPQRRYLEAIVEENSDLSENNEERPWENAELIRQANNIDHIPNDWIDSDEGIDTSWRGGKSIDEVSDVLVISDSHSDSELLSDNIKLDERDNTKHQSSHEKNLKIVAKNDKNKVLGKPPINVVHTYRITGKPSTSYKSVSHSVASTENPSYPSLRTSTQVDPTNQQLASKNTSSSVKKDNGAIKEPPEKEITYKATCIVNDRLGQKSSHHSNGSIEKGNPISSKAKSEVIIQKVSEYSKCTSKDNNAAKASSYGAPKTTSDHELLRPSSSKDHKVVFKDSLNYIKTTPSSEVVKNVVSSYYNTKSFPEKVNISENNRNDVKTSVAFSTDVVSPGLQKDIELIYIDSSDSDAFSNKSNLSHSNRTSLTLDNNDDPVPVENIGDCRISEPCSNINTGHIIKEVITNINQSVKEISDICCEQPKGKKRSLQISTKNKTNSHNNNKLIALPTLLSPVLERKSIPNKSKQLTKRRYSYPFSDQDIYKNALTCFRIEGSEIPDYIQAQENTPTTKENKSKLDLTRRFPSQPRDLLTNDSCHVKDFKETIETNKEEFQSNDSIFMECSEGSISSESYTLPDITNDNLLLSDVSSEITQLGRPGVSPKCVPHSPVEVEQIVDLHKKFVERRGYHEASPSTKRKLLKEKTPEPDLIVLSKSQDKSEHAYAPELLAEAANLLALHKYHETRQKKMRQNNKVNAVTSCTKNDLDSEMSVKPSVCEGESKEISNAKNIDKECKNELKENSDCSLNEKAIGEKPVNKSVAPENETVGKSRLLELFQKLELKSSSSDCTNPEPFPYWLILGDELKLDDLERLAGNSNVTDCTITDKPSQCSDSENVKSIQEPEDNDSSLANESQSEVVSKSERITTSSEARPISIPTGEIFQRKMYEEYLGKIAEMAERRSSKVIKISNVPTSLNPPSENLFLESEFMAKLKERNEKLGIKIDNEDEIEKCNEPVSEKQNLPKHLKELMEITEECGGVWSPAQTPEAERKKFDFSKEIKEEKEKEKRKEEETQKDPQPPIWTPRSAGPSPTLERKFRPVNFQSPPPTRKEIKTTNETPELPKELPPEEDKDSKRLTSSSSENSTLSPSLRLPAAQNPTITLLQKAREGQIPRGAQYLEEQPTIGHNEIIYTVKREQVLEDQSRKIVDLGPRKIDGIGPTTKEGIPTVLRSEVKEDNQQKWYKRMYDSLHKADYDKDFVTVKYKTKRKGQYPYSYSGGYASEPERLGYDSDASISKYATLDRRKIKNKENDFTTSTMPRNRYAPGVKFAVNVYKNQPGRIEDYEPGHSSIADKETKQWWDEVMDIFDGELNENSRPNHFPANIGGKPYTYSLKDTGYESDSTLVFKRRENNMSSQLLSPADQKMAYKVIQKGGEVPFQGLRKTVPERPKEPLGNPIPTPPRDSTSRQRIQESPHRYVESEVNIHYRSPVRREAKAAWPEDELAQRQAEIMRRIYQEQKRTKYLNELHDMYSRRHADNLLPSQKSPIPLNRYDDFPVEVQPPRPRDRTPEPKLVARALYNFVGQSSRELSFRRGDIIYVRRQIDKNWYEGEHNAMVGLFPFNYVEIIPYDGIRTLPKKASEGQARAKFNFQAQTHLELSLVKGELVLLTRRVDENWFEGRIGNRKGIFPVSYVEVLVEPGERAVSPTGRSTPSKPIVAPASHSVMLNGAKDLGQQQYQPPRPAIYSSSSLPPSNKLDDISLVNQSLHIDTHSDPVPYRVMYNYRPQNEDELELNEGDVVYVMEKCDDGWYVGSLHRNGQFGTFPGNYVERIQ